MDVRQFARTIRCFLQHLQRSRGIWRGDERCGLTSRMHEPWLSSLVLHATCALGLGFGAPQHGPRVERRCRIHKMQSVKMASTSAPAAATPMAADPKSVKIAILGGTHTLVSSWTSDEPRKLHEKSAPGSPTATCCAYNSALRLCAPTLTFLRFDDAMKAIALHFSWVVS